MGDEALKKKKKIPGGHKGYVTKTLERIQSLLDRFEPTVVKRESIHEMMVKMDEVLLAEVENNSDKSNSHSVTPNSFSDGLGVKAKLPKISLKRFHGDPMLFSPFWDSFVSAVDENQALSDLSVMTKCMINNRTDA